MRIRIEVDMPDREYEVEREAEYVSYYNLPAQAEELLDLVVSDVRKVMDRG